MLTRLMVSGFKNLVDVDVRFGPFTCVAGPNGVGKSNLFDAIRFLSALADGPLIEAALSVRNEGERMTDVRSLFHRVGDTYASEMSFQAEMIVPSQAWDDLGQEASASITFLRYSLVLGYKEEEGHLTPGALEILKEELVHITQRDAARHLLFDHSATRWRRSAVRGQRRVPYFISTEGRGSNRVIKLHQDGGSSGRPLRRPAINLPRTVLSASNAAESPTVLVARREMQSWRLLQLEPSSLRQPDEFTAPTHLGVDGSHLAATLYRLARANGKKGANGQTNDVVARQIYSQVGNRLAELIDDVHDLYIDRDDKRELLTLYVKSRDGTPHPARALSDGTLRFLALAILEVDPETQGLLCLEEPENGIHPERIPAMLHLLRDIATDIDEPIGSDNPLRQMIVNTHSPSVVKQVPDDSLLVAGLKEAMDSSRRRFGKACFVYLPDTWREREGGKADIVLRGDLLAYLNPVLPEEWDDEAEVASSRKERRVVDREDVQLVLSSSW